MEDWLQAIHVTDDNENSEPAKKRESPKKATKCKFSIVGCPFMAVKGTREMRRHLKSNFERHLSLMCKTVKDQDDEMRKQRQRIEQQGEVIDNLTRAIRELSDKVDEQMTRRNQETKRLDDLRDDLNTTNENVAKQEQACRESLQVISEKVDQFLLEHPGDVKDSCRTGEHVWIIHNFTRRLQRIQQGKADDPIRSEPFYTAIPGYRLCIWVYLNGRGKSLGSAVSVYGQMLAGEYDPILEWPVRPEFTFTIFQPNSDGPERRNITKTRRVHGIKRDKGGIHRPQAEERSIIIGFDDFVTHEDLELCRYIEGENVFLKIEAEIFD